MKARVINRLLKESNMAGSTSRLVNIATNKVMEVSVPNARIPPNCYAPKVMKPKKRTTEV